LVGAVIQRVEGSPDLYRWQGRSTSSSINFITCHDGFTLMDLVSYDGKHNEANGEDNRDGSNDADSWNCGWEGPTEDSGTNFLRMKQIKNALTILMISQGIPMVLSGDEIGNTQLGNNNAYCQDNEISWLDWSLVEHNSDLFNFFKKMIAFRHAHPVLRSREHFRNTDYVGSGYPDISWHGTRAWYVDFSEQSRCIACLLCGKHAKSGTCDDNTIYVAMNMHWEMHGFELPSPPPGERWHVFANTDVAPPHDIWDVGSEQPLDNEYEVLVGPRSVVVLVAK